MAADITVTRTENDALLERLKGGLEPRGYDLAAVTEAGEAPLLLIPQGMTAFDPKKILDQYRNRPDRRMGNTTLADLPSFLAFVERHAGPSSVIFADYATRRLQAIFNYHDEGPEDVGRDASLARHCDHTATLTFGASVAWSAWKKANGEAMPQGVFAEFIEDRAIELVDPAALGPNSGVLALCAKLGLSPATPAEVIGASRGLRMRAEVNVGEAVTLASGETEVMFSERHTGEGGERLRVPQAFIVAVPVFEHSEAEVLLARLRYRRKESRIYWMVALHQFAEIERLAFKDAVAKVSETTGLPLYFT